MQNCHRAPFGSPYITGNLSLNDCLCVQVTSLPTMHMTFAVSCPNPDEVDQIPPDYAVPPTDGMLLFGQQLTSCLVMPSKDVSLL